MNSSDQQSNPAAGWLSDVFEHSPDMIIVLDRAGVIRRSNQAFQIFCGERAATLVGRKLTEFIQPEAQQQWAHDLSKLLSGEWTSLDSALRGSEGRTIPFQATLVAHSTDEGVEVNILHFGNVSAFQTVERALVASQQQWERSFDAIQDYMCVLDRAGRILRANRAMSERFQPIYGNVVGLDYRAIIGQARELPHAIATAPFTSPAIELPRLKGFFTVSAFPLKDEHDTVSGAVLIGRDITAEYTTAQALQKAQACQHQSSKMEALGRLAGSIAHEFNNALTSVLGYSALLLKAASPDDPKRKEIQEIIQAAERAAALTRQLLDFSRSQPAETSPLNLNAVIQTMQELLRHTLGEKINLRLRLDEALGNIKADPARLEQVIINIVMNARDAMVNGGQLLIETCSAKLDDNFCAKHSGLTPGRYCLLEISDTGCGMTPEVLEHLFEPFFTTKAKGKGTGLGLTTTYGIVKQFGGHITVYSEVGRGTTFKIYFPESAEESLPGVATRREVPLRRGQETILVVDDESNIVSMIRKVLSDLGYSVITATNPQEALALSDGQTQAVDLVLADVIMPQLNGPDLVRLLRQKRPKLKALYMSGYATQAAARIGAFDSATAFLSKPFTLETLTSSIRKVLDATGK